MYSSAFISALPDVDKKGIVAVYVDVGHNDGQSMGKTNLRDCLKCLSCTSSLPIKFSSIHYCVNTSTRNLAINNSLISMFVKTFPRFSTVRTRFHYGSLMEMQYQLQGHGIPTQGFPIDSNGNIRQHFIAKSCMEHFRLEASQYREKADSVNGTSSSAEANSKSMEDKSMTEGKKLAVGNTLDPRPMDVLLGRGRKIQNHLGNVELRGMVVQCQIEYDSKIRMIERRHMVQQIKKSCDDKGVRFLKQSERRVWILAESAEADEKIRQHFRSGRKRK